eukprot:comp17204_c0_seq1/m.16139 comp17204_c0_seq1/g.16139  ORF comp17204_c0_seq1/g.16139 comp17204_c0_seq1/m.16139 type:complete len:102 (-) comp17204_c0_seq1:655-960(-)
MAYVLTVQLNYLTTHTSYRLEKSRGAPPQFVEPLAQDAESSDEECAAISRSYHKGRRLCKQCSKCVRAAPYRRTRRRSNKDDQEHKDTAVDDGSKETTSPA